MEHFDGMGTSSHDQEHLEVQPKGWRSTLPTDLPWVFHLWESYEPTGIVSRHGASNLKSRWIEILLIRQCIFKKSLAWGVASIYQPWLYWMIGHSWRPDGLFRLLFSCARAYEDTFLIYRITRSFGSCSRTYTPWLPTRWHEVAAPATARHYLWTSSMLFTLVHRIIKHLTLKHLTVVTMEEPTVPTLAISEITKPEEVILYSKELSKKRIAKFLNGGVYAGL